MAVEIDGRRFDRRELVGGQILYTHTMDKCSSREFCTVHNRSDHHMLTWPQHWRSDAGFMEVICPHDIGHPDPDEINKRGNHGCDGCCYRPKKEVEA